MTEYKDCQYRTKKPRLNSSTQLNHREILVYMFYMLKAEFMNKEVTSQIGFQCSENKKIV